MDLDDNYTVIVKNAYKKYFRSTQVLCGLNMKVPKGQMYGLLGPSGCGKTTLLKCILGKSDIDSGTIDINVHRWKQIGFMPQEVSIHSELTIRESFKFYGMIHGLADNNLNQRIQEMHQLLELPDLDKIADRCSGGQKRRISLAITLLHDPDFLLLDEPTVGLDPLLSHKIWSYLIDLSHVQKKTIIITTHYMEEARSLHVVGLMREGILLAEECPESLISRYECDSIDEVFVKVIYDKKAIKHKVDFVDTVKSTPNIENEEKFSWNRLGAQLYKNHKWAVRNLAITLYSIVLPVTMISVCIYGYALGSSTRELGVFSEEILDGRNCSIKNAIQAVDCPPSPYYSCQYIEIMRHKSLIKTFNSLEDGLKAVESGETYGLLHFPHNFSSSIVSRMSFRLNEVEDSNIDQQLQVWLDHSIYHIGFMGRFNIYDALQKFLEEKCKECNIDVRLAQSTLSIRLQPPIFGEGYSHISSSMPGLILSFMFYMAYVYTSSLLSREKSSNVIQRDEFNGLTVAEILCGNLINQFIIMNLQTILMMVVAYGILKEASIGNPILVYVLLLLDELHGCLLGLLIALFTSSAFAIQFLGVGIVFMAIFLNGTAWPLQGMHWLLKYLANVYPLSVLTVSYSHVTLHGFSLSHPFIYFGFLYMIGANLALTICIYLKIRFNKYQL